MADKEPLEEVKSPIVMKVDAPPDDNNSASLSSEENDSNDKKDCDNENSGAQSTLSDQHTSRVPVLAKPKFGIGNPFAIKPSVLSSPKLNLSNNSSKSILRPSKLSTKSDETNSTPSSSTELTNNVKKPFALNPPQLNPFLKAAASDVVSTSTANDDPDVVSNSQSNTIPTSTTPLIDPPRFVPLTGPTSQNNSNSATNFTLNSSGSFVFGQNLHERVIGENVDGNNGVENSTPVPSSSCSNGTASSTTAETLFSSAAVVNDKSNEVGAAASSEAKSLSEAAREYEESRAQKRKYEEVTVITGEENEENIMQISCKLFAFDQTTRNWQERGRGNLRLNDIVTTPNSSGDDKSSAKNDVQSRLVVRSAGSLRVVLNTKIWAGMSVELASPKSIRLTAMDSSGVVKVFLVMANVKEIEKLHKLLKNRVDGEIKRNQNKLLESTADTGEPVSKRKPSTSDLTV